MDVDWNLPAKSYCEQIFAHLTTQIRIFVSPILTLPIPNEDVVYQGLENGAIFLDLNKNMSNPDNIEDFFCLAVVRGSSQCWGLLFASTHPK